MRRVNEFYAAATLLLCFGIGGLCQAAEFDKLVPRIPGEANTIIALDVSTIFSSGVAQRENWKQQYSDNFAATPLILPPNATHFLLGAEIDIQTMKPQWNAASMRLSVNPAPRDIVKITGGTLDDLSNVEVIWPMRSFCIAKFADHQFGVLSPASRQVAGRWIENSVAASNGQLSPYLRQAIHYAEGAGPEVIMAFDLKNIIRPAEIHAAVERSEILKGIDPVAATKVLSSLRGITLGVGVRNRIQGKLNIDFGEDVKLLEPVAKPLILSVLENFGASLDELEDWQPRMTEKRIALAGDLTTDGMRRLFSLVHLDTAIIDPARIRAHEQESQQQDQPDTNLMATASYRYFNSIMKYLQDLQRPSRKKNDVASKALWVSNYAEKIEKLPTRNVDPDLVAYADQIVYLMRDAVAHAHGIAQAAAERAEQVQVVSNVRVGAVPTANVNNYGGVRVREYAPMAFANVDVGGAMREREAISREASNSAAQAAQQIIGQIQNETDAIRKKMSERYARSF